MASLNKMQIIGHLGRDPETRYSQGGDCICNIAVATTESWKDKTTGEKKELTEWHRVVLYRKLGEIASQYLQKGSQVYLEGKLHTRKWTDKDGVERYTTEIIADVMKMLGAKQQDDVPQQRQQQGGQRQRNQSQAAQNFSDMDDGSDIPF